MVVALGDEGGALAAGEDEEDEGGAEDGGLQDRGEEPGEEADEPA